MIHLPGTPPGTLSPMLDAIVQEVDIRTGLVIWEWHAYGHIPLARVLRDARRTAPPTTRSTSTRSRTLGGGHVLISARDTSAIYNVDRASGKIEWTLGGKASDFQPRQGRPVLVPARRADAPRPPRQHVRRPGGSAAEGADLARPDPEARRRTASGRPVAGSTRAPDDTSAQSEGSLQTPAGRRTCSPASAPSRSSRSSPRPASSSSTPACPSTTAATASTASPGAPRRRPSPTSRRSAPRPSHVTVYASWNGATDGARKWQVLAGPTRTRAAGRDGAGAGFETRIDVQSTRQHVRRPRPGRRRPRPRHLPRDGHVTCKSAAQLPADRHRPAALPAATGRRSPGWLEELMPNDAELARTGMTLHQGVLQHGDVLAEPRDALHRHATRPSTA